MKNALLDWAQRRGWLAAWGPARVLGQVRDDLAQRVERGEIDGAFARENLAFDFGGEEAAGSRVLVLVMPRPAHSVRFMVHGKAVELLLPPTYQRYRPTFEDIRGELAAGPLAGCRVTTLTAPLKPLAARLGLVRYGRNNVTYAPGIGSYLQLLGYLTDAPLPIEGAWMPAEPSLLDECESCGICAAVCPTQAIDEDRVLLRAERCLTLANETAGPWPPNLPEAHHCLVGCLLCQQNCPANPTLPTVETGVVFTSDETAALMAEGEHAGPAWDGIRAHLQALGQPYLEPVIGRNLRAVLRARRA